MMLAISMSLRFSHRFLGLLESADLAPEVRQNRLG